MRVVVPLDFSQDADWGLWLHIIPRKSQGTLGGGKCLSLGPKTVICGMLSLKRPEAGQDCKLERVFDVGTRNQDSSPSSAFNCYVSEV